MTQARSTWTAGDDRVILAKFVRYETEAVVIEKDGVVFKVPLLNLSPASMVLARKLGEAAAAKATPAPSCVMPCCMAPSPPLRKAHRNPSCGPSPRAMRCNPKVTSWAAGATLSKALATTAPEPHPMC